MGSGQKLSQDNWHIITWPCRIKTLHPNSAGQTASSLLHHALHRVCVTGNLKRNRQRGIGEARWLGPTSSPVGVAFSCFSLTKRGVFDIIDYSLLIETHIYYGFTPSAILWIRSYRFNRTQKVYFHRSLSNIIQVESGILQGSYLGPIIFSIFTYGMPLALCKARVAI